MCVCVYACLCVYEYCLSLGVSLGVFVSVCICVCFHLCASMCGYMCVKRESRGSFFVSNEIIILFRHMLFVLSAMINRL